MSWDSYTDNLIKRSNDYVSGIFHTEKACIIGLDGGLWTTAGSANTISLNQMEAVNIAKCFRSKDFSQFISSGIIAEGQKYIFLKQDNGKIVYGKLKRHGVLTLQPSKTAIVIAYTSEFHRPGNTNRAVHEIAKYLESRNM